MSQWSLLHLTSPWQTAAGEPSLVRELTVASSRSMKYSNVAGATLEFSLPGNHRQTAALQPLVSDILAWRDDVCVQRFRVVSRVLSKDSGVLEAQFTAVSYRELLGNRLIHGSDIRSWASIEQTTAAWNLISAAQSRSPSSALGILRGPLPTNTVNRVLQPEGSFGGSLGTNAEEFFAEGMKTNDAVDQLAVMDHGFAWDIIPNPDDPYDSLKAYFWTVDDGGRAAGETSSLLLHDGGSIASWSHAVTPAEYGNLVRLTGAEPTAFNVTGATSDAVWQRGPLAANVGENPVENPSADPPTPREGRWEVEGGSSDLQSESAVASAGPAAWKAAHDLAPEITVTLARGRWEGPTQLWLGSQARLIITEPVDGTPDQYVLYIDELVSVVEIDVTVDDLGAEDVQLSINRPTYDAARDAQRVNDRLGRMERR